VLVVKHPQSPSIPKLNQAAVVLVNAAHVIVALPVKLALQVSMDAMVSMDSQANQEIAVHQLQMEACHPDKSKNNAHAPHHPEMLAHKDPVAPMDPQATLVLQVLMVNQAALDQLDQPDPLANLEKTAAPALQANPAIPDKVDLAPQAQQAPTANPAQQAPTVNPVDLAKMAVPAPQAVPVMLVLQVVLAMLAVPVVLARLVAQVLQAVANTAHQLVWLQVIKRQPQAKFCGNTKYRRRSKRTSLSIDIFPQFISASFVFTSQF